MRIMLSDLELEFDVESNTPLTFEHLTPGRRAPVNWHCENGHIWSATVSNRLRGSACGYCSGKRLLKGFNDLKTQYPKLCAEWDYDLNEKNPEDYFPYSN